jgi:hypothetical protein
MLDDSEKLIGIVIYIKCAPLRRLSYRVSSKRPLYLQRGTDSYTADRHHVNEERILMPPQPDTLKHKYNVSEKAKVQLQKKLNNIPVE